MAVAFDRPVGLLKPTYCPRRSQDLFLSCLIFSLRILLNYCLYEYNRIYTFFFKIDLKNQLHTFNILYYFLSILICIINYVLGLFCCCIFCSKIPLGSRCTFNKHRGELCKFHLHQPWWHACEPCLRAGGEFGMG